MNKFLKAIMCAGLCGTMVFAAACGEKNPGTTDNPGGDTSQTYDTEKRPLVLSLGAVDGTFNPFFYTSLTDGQVVSMTQSSLITTKVVTSPNGRKEVEPAAGDEYPTIAKDFTITYFRPDGSKTANSAEAAEGGKTEYEFLIKNGMKFADGTPITIKDVLFNFYVYLDSSYTGSNTMYSVNIQGLRAYQENDSNLDDNAGSLSAIDEGNADIRVNDIINWSSYENVQNEAQVQSDVAKVLEFFEEELNSDWTSNATSWTVNYETNYSFEYAWQAFLFMEGYISIQQEIDGSGRVYDIRVDENGNKIDPINDAEAYKLGRNLTTLERYHDDCNYNKTGGDIGAMHIIDAIAEATSSDKIAEYKKNNPGSTDEQAYDELSKAWCVKYIYDGYSNRGDIQKIFIYGWNTSRTAYNYFVADEHGKRTSSSESPMYYISGLQTYKTSTFNGANLGEEYDVFKIVVNDVDPAAIWQFGVSIAPLNYYSGTWTNPDTGVTKNYVTSFNGDQNGGYGPGDETTCFGLERANITFLSEVVQSKTKSGLPMGAGAYMPADSNYNATTSYSQFSNNGYINYVRNPYFETMGEQIDNAKIRILRYRVIDEDKIIASLNAGEIDYGEPNATPANMQRVEGSSSLGYSSYQTNGYGYVGINAGKVPDVEVRKIIMGVMDTSKALRYYGQNLATNIYRSMSVTSWAYPEDVSSLGDKIPSYTDSQAIQTYLLNHGYSLQGGVLTNNETGEKLEYTFTIAGATSDHPAYEMFDTARDILNAAGFNIKVSTDPNALIKLTNGGLEVWAAAWSAGVDPDMYQVWHKDSNATSILNWGYDVMKQDTSKYSYEWNIVEALSAEIEAARSTDDRNERIEIYGRCLDYVLDLAVELPIYQRNDLCVYNKTVIDAKSLNQNPDCYLSLINNIWEVNYL